MDGWILFAGNATSDLRAREARSRFFHKLSAEGYIVEGIREKRLILRCLAKRGLEEPAPAKAGDARHRSSRSGLSPSPLFSLSFPEIISERRLVALSYIMPVLLLLACVAPEKRATQQAATAAERGLMANPRL